MFELHWKTKISISSFGKLLSHEFCSRLWTIFPSFFPNLVFLKTYASCLFKIFLFNSLIMSCASRKEHVYIANTLSWITKQHILLYLRAKNSLNRENSLCGHRIFYNVQGMTHWRLTACTCNQPRKIDNKLVGHAKQIVDFLIACCVPAIKVTNHYFASIQ